MSFKGSPGLAVGLAPGPENGGCESLKALISETTAGSMWLASARLG